MKRFPVRVMFPVGPATSAPASDLPPPAAPPRAPAVYLPPAPVYNWGGFYFGINGGYSFGKTDWSGPGGTTGNFNAQGGRICATPRRHLPGGTRVFWFAGEFDSCS